MKYPSLNGLRAISVLLVVFMHTNFGVRIATGQNIFSSIESNPVVAFFLNFFLDGQLGVDIFFVISGFLITSLLLSEEKKNKRVDVKSFYIRRTLRIFPAYYAMLSAYYILQRLGYIHLSDASWLTSVTYTKYFNGALDQATVHAWSLSVEEQFYLVYPFIFLAGAHFRKWWAWLLLVIVPTLRIYFHYQDQLPQGERLFPYAWSSMTLFTRIDGIAVGCLLAFYKDAILERLKPYFAPAFYLSLIGLLVLCNLPNHNTNNLINVAYGGSAGTLANVFVSIIILYSVFGAQEKSLWFRFLNSRPMDYIGQLSYSLYLWQQIWILGGIWSWYTAFPQNLLFIFITAMASYHLIEKPFLKLRDKFKA